jgi:sterol desaturase/sphingolipid hydroxylase (fatty acid hydroxylase superfamily)
LFTALVWPATLVASLFAAYVLTIAGVHPVVTLVGLALVVLAWCTALERAFPFRQAWSSSPRAWRTDLAHLAFTEFGTQAVFRGALYGAAALVSVSVVPVEGPWVAAGLDHLPTIVQLLIAAAILDLALYWQHRLLHEIPLLWRFHAVHHSPEHMAAITAIRNPPLGPWLTATSVAAFGLLGMPAEIRVMTLMWIITKGWLQHANLEMRTSWFDRVFQTPLLHRFHHSERPHEADTNFSLLLTVWDRVPWHRIPWIGSRLRFQRATFFLPEVGSTPDRLGVGRSWTSDDRSALQNWVDHVRAPFGARTAAFRRAVLAWSAWPVVVAITLGSAWWAYGRAPLALIGLSSFAIAWVLSEGFQRLNPMPRPELHGTARDTWIDVAHMTLSTGGSHGIVKLLLALGAASIGWSLAPAESVWARTGLLDAPVWLQFVAGSLLIELAWYWQHRLMHEIPALWATHEVHHAIRTLGPTRAGRNHPLSPALTTLVWAGFGALGGPPVVFVLCQAMTAAAGMLEHSYADVRMGPLEYVFTSPRMHRWHHSADFEESNTNYGPTWSVWDHVPWHRIPGLGRRLMIQRVTFARGRDEGPRTIGTETWLERPDRSALHNWWRQVMHPIGRWRQMLGKDVAESPPSLGAQREQAQQRHRGRAAEAERSDRPDRLHAA